MELSVPSGQATMGDTHIVEGSSPLCRVGIDGINLQGCLKACDSLFEVALSISGRGGRQINTKFILGIGDLSPVLSIHEMPIFICQYSAFLLIKSVLFLILRGAKRACQQVTKRIFGTLTYIMGFVFPPWHGLKK